MLRSAVLRRFAPIAQLKAVTGSSHAAGLAAKRARSGQQHASLSPASFAHLQRPFSVAVERAEEESVVGEDEAVYDSESDDDMEEEDPSDMKPDAICRELDRHIVGQSEAKRAVALALRNRWRRKKLGDNMRDEVMPKNILMIGSTGVGKTEIARRLAKLVSAPFIKVEATKYTEIGFHGRDVDSIIRDLMEHAITMIKTKRRRQLKKKIQRHVEARILEALVGPSHDPRGKRDFIKHLRSGILDDQTITVEVPIKEPDMGSVGSIHPQAANVLINLNKQLGGKKTEKKKMKISEARQTLEEQETENLLSAEDVTKEALEAVQQDGIVFLDEVDKICSTNDRHSADASAEGVQRDLLPLIEGSTINTKHGNVDTDHILFIASGAFHSCKPSDLLAELQGRLPIRVNLKALSQADLHRILTEPENNLIRQQVALIGTEGVELEIGEEAVSEIAKVAHEANTSVENIGARRLHTVIERVMEPISYEASNMEAGTKITVTKEQVRERVADLLKAMDLRKYLL